MGIGRFKQIKPEHITELGNSICINAYNLLKLYIANSLSIGFNHKNILFDKFETSLGYTASVGGGNAVYNSSEKAYEVGSSGGSYDTSTEYNLCISIPMESMPYWTKDGEDKVWVRLNLTGGENTSFYVYYGSADAPSYADGDAVFEFFDDFEGTSLDTNKWYEVQGPINISNSEMILEDGAKVGINNRNFEYNTTIRIKYTNIEGNHDFRVDIFANTYQSRDDTVEILIPWEGGDSRVDKINGGGAVHSYYTGGEYIYGTDLQVKIFCFYDEKKVKVIKTNGDVVIPLTSVDRYGGYVLLHAGGDNLHDKVDYIFITKYAENEPTVTYGSEETGTWEINGYTYTKRKLITISSTEDLVGFQVSLNKSEFNNENNLFLRLNTTEVIISKPIECMYIYADAGIPENTQIKVDISLDGGETWIIENADVNSAIDFPENSGGNLAIRFKLKTNDSSKTPKLYGYAINIWKENV